MNDLSQVQGPDHDLDARSAQEPRPESAESQRSYERAMARARIEFQARQAGLMPEYGPELEAG